MTRISGALLGIALLAVSGCAGGTASAPPSVDVTGSWSGQWTFEDPSAGNGLVSFNLKQTGSDVAGEVSRIVGARRVRANTFKGVVAGNELRILGDVTGYLTVKGDEMSGTVNGILPARVTLKRDR
jgi:hypothetical protein